jgi:restriction system protein
MVAYIFDRFGFQVELTKKSRDGGRDIIALRTDELGIPLRYLIECKRYAKDRPVGVGIVRSLFGVQQAEGANKSLIVTTSSFSADARRFAGMQNTTAILMSLVDFGALKRWIDVVLQGAHEHRKG